jgi:peptidoglycan hydrolase-like protein with peptidoglycan-binding domain
VRRRAFAGAAVLAAAGVAVVVLSTGAEPATVSAQAPPATTARVERGDLSSTISLAGTLTYRAQPDGAPYPAVNRASGTYTELPDAGDEVDCGDALYRVDERPVLLLCGAVPAYRDLRLGDAGRDVRQLNRNLHALGLGADPDDHDFTWRTASGLRRLQARRGCEATGALDAGDAVVLPAPGRILGVTGRLGGAARPGAQVAQATSGTLGVQVELDASQQGEVRKGDRVRIALPGNRAAQGRVGRLGSVARTPGEDDDAGAATIPAFIRLEDPGKARGLDRAPVRVEIRTRGVEDALSVPVTALLGRAGGGFAVEVVRAGGGRELVPVELGLYDTAGGRVEVDGELGEGDPVVVPAP